jgi:tRNA(adenine34) deaminase
MIPLTPDHLDHWMRQALATAQQALPQDVPVGALLLDADGNLVGQAYNQRELAHNPIGHAELLLLQEAGATRQNWRMSGATMVVTLEPCPMCAEAIRQARVSRLVFGAYDPLLGACGSKTNVFANTSEVTILGGIQETACQQALQAFFQAQRR